MPKPVTCRECREALTNQKMTNQPGVVLCPLHAMVDRLAEALRIARDGRMVEGFGAYADELQAEYDRLKGESR